MLRFFWRGLAFNGKSERICSVFWSQASWWQQLTFFRVNGNAPFSMRFRWSVTHIPNRWTAMLRFWGCFSAFSAILNGNTPFFKPILSRFSHQKRVDRTVLSGWACSVFASKCYFQFERITGPFKICSNALSARVTSVCKKRLAPHQIPVIKDSKITPTS